MTISSKVAAAAFCAAALPIWANAAVLDFGSGVTDGSTFTTYSEDGFTFAVSTTGGTAGAALFSTTCVIDGVNCGGDLDLVPAAQGDGGVEGRILIRQETGVTGVSDDAATAGTITFTLLNNRAFRWTGASAIDDTTFTFSTSVDGDLGSITLGEGEPGQLDFATPSSILRAGDSITFAMGGSGGVDSLLLTPVPVPASLPLLAGAAGLMGFAARRRKSRSA